MNDQINRQKLIEELEKVFKKFHYVWGEDGLLGKAVYDTIMNIPPADQWIPCSERPPEEPCFYTVEDRSPYTLKRHGKPRRKVVTVKPYMWDVYDHVVAWKPIDMEPYKGD